ncbi:hypothetical protein SAMN05444921_1204 [Streptomyces wuyuanensis]|uniref:Uncharacterized protein n=1 Tax=Streptomyces wuyuanensis TaxID=1196353 RepID=A0A1G9YZI5_9ACTN|nr:hypothetical protein SAMN05444921_1204 [Streptomyces wuyuanensis]
MPRRTPRSYARGVNPIALAAVALPVTVLLCGHLALLAWRSRRRRQADTERHRADRAHCDALVLDPYDAAVFRADETGAAAARLLLDGLVRIDRRGFVRLNDAGLDPHRRAGHPAPDALLDAVRREGAPVTLGWILRQDMVYEEARQALWGDCHARLPHPPEAPKHWGDGAGAAVLGCTGVAVMVAQWAFCGIALTTTAPTGAGQVVAATAVFLALIAQLGWMCRVSALREREQEWARTRPGRWGPCAGAVPRRLRIRRSPRWTPRASAGWV